MLGCAYISLVTKHKGDFFHPVMRPRDREEGPRHRDSEL